MCPITVESVLDAERSDSKNGSKSLSEIRSFKDIPRKWIYIAIAGAVAVWILSSQSKKQAGSGEVGD